MRFILLPMLIISLVHAAIVGPTVHEQDDFGDILWNEFTYSLSVDCDNAVLRVVVMDENIKPVEGAGTYLKYVDYATPLISSGASGKDGRVMHQLPGNVSLMRGLFVLVIEKEGYRTKEIHFDIMKCLGNQTGVPTPPAQPPQQPPQQPTQNVTKEPPPEPVQNETDTADSKAIANETEATENDGVDELAHSGLLVIALLVLLLIFFKRKQLK